MNVEQLRNYCLSLKGVSEDCPFGPETLVFRVMGKIFALTGLDADACTVNLKCDPDYAIELREEYVGTITPGYHMNKKHWNTVHCEENVPDELICRLIVHSYQLIVASLKKIEREELQQMP